MARDHFVNPDGLTVAKNDQGRWQQYDKDHDVFVGSPVGVKKPIPDPTASATTTTTTTKTTRKRVLEPDQIHSATTRTVEDEVVADEHEVRVRRRTQPSFFEGMGNMGKWAAGIGGFLLLLLVGVLVFNWYVNDKPATTASVPTAPAVEMPATADVTAGTPAVVPPAPVVVATPEVVIKTEEASLPRWATPTFEDLGSGESVDELAGLPDTPENREREMIRAGCPDELRYAVDDGYAPWDDMQYNGSFYSYNLALVAECGVESSVLVGDMTPDFYAEFIVQGELTPDQQALLDQMVDQVLNH